MDSTRLMQPFAESRRTMTRFGLEEHILDKLRVVLAAHPAVERAVIYGSRAKGTFKPASDIDLAAYAPRLDANEFVRLRFEIQELPIVFKLDVAHVDALTDASLAHEIATHGVEFFRAARLPR